jgi:hypothetical protein
MPKALLRALLDLSRSFDKVAFTHNVMSVKDAASAVAGYTPGYDFRHPSPDHVPHQRSQIDILHKLRDGNSYGVGRVDP